MQNDEINVGVLEWGLGPCAGDFVLGRVEPPKIPAEDVVVEGEVDHGVHHGKCDMFGNLMITCPHCLEWESCNICWCEHDCRRQICNICNKGRGDPLGLHKEECVQEQQQTWQQQWQDNSNVINFGELKMLDMCPFKVDEQTSKAVRK